MTGALPRPTLMLVTDRHMAGGDAALVHAVSEAVAGGVNLVQLREKDLDNVSLISLAKSVRDAIDGRAKMTVNGRVDVARAIGADGVHLSEIATAVRDDAMLVGRSVHSLESARVAESEGVDYVVLGPVFDTPSHAETPGAGVSMLATVAAGVSAPVLAIGGITAERVDEVMSAGAAGVAVISAILGSTAPREAARELWEALGTRVG
jgi:thiamine-phosphate pyrophosphorylase